MSNNPLIPNNQPAGSDTAAVELIRSKVAHAFGSEPNAAQELAEAEGERHPSKHQKFIAELAASGKSLAEIQTAWHHYYTTLSDNEKHEVWQEFYAAHSHTPYQKLFQKQQAVSARKREDVPAEPSAPPATQPAPAPEPQPRQSGAVVGDHSDHAAAATRPDPKVTRRLKQQIAAKVNRNGKLQLRHHFQSLAFGLASGFIVLVVLLFSFFNEYIIAPFIQPSRKVTATPIILSDTSASADTPPSVTVPKINIQIPIDFNVPTTDEAQVEDGLKTGVVHYANTSMPGQNGNGAYFGHSAVNIFNNGVKYKFAFSLLHELTTGDLFYITYGGKTYAYRVFDREIVPPTDVGVINDSKGKQATATLITCDPPGFSTNRLVVWGEQISPDPSGNSNPTPDTTAAPTQIAGNGPTMWNRFIGWLEFWK